MSLDDKLRNASQRDVERALQDNSPEAVISALQQGRFSRRTLGKGALAAIAAAVIGYDGRASAQSGSGWVTLVEDLFNDGVVPYAGDGRYVTTNRNFLDPPAWEETGAAKDASGLLTMRGANSPDAEYIFTAGSGNRGLRVRAKYDGIAEQNGVSYGIHLGDGTAFDNFVELLISRDSPTDNPYLAFFCSNEDYADDRTNPLAGASEVLLQLTRDPNTCLVTAEYNTDGNWHQVGTLSSNALFMPPPLDCSAGLINWYDDRDTEYRLKSFSFERFDETAPNVPVAGGIGSLLMVAYITKKAFEYFK